MALSYPFQQLFDLRHEAHLLIEQAGDQEEQLETFVAEAEQDARSAEAAVSHAGQDLSVDEIRRLLAAHLQRSAAGAAAARRILRSAHRQNTAARRLLSYLDSEHRVGAPNAVLVVDDYDDVREAVAHVLRDAGFLVRTAANGLEGLLAAYEMHPGVIVMDVTMPILDGIEATRLIKAGETTRDARVIAYTGNPSSTEGPVRTLFAAVLTKPSTPRAVLATVQQVAGL
jgi:two-component system, cell cycle response regulator DivK